MLFELSILISCAAALGGLIQFGPIIPISILEGLQSSSALCM